MGWSVENDGLGVIFDKEIPRFIKKELPSVINKFFSIKKKRFYSSLRRNENHKFIQKNI